MSDNVKKPASASAAEPLEPEIGRLLQPTRFFRHPRDVTRDATLTTVEKRAILSSWASDACAVESMPALRQMPGSGCIVRFDDVIDALRELDGKPDSVEGIQRRRRDRRRGGIRRTAQRDVAIGFEPFWR
jgi:hypothetical protein